MTATLVVVAEEEVVEAEVAAHRQMLVNAAVLLDAGKMSITKVGNMSVDLYSGKTKFKRYWQKLCNAVSAVFDNPRMGFFSNYSRKLASS